MPHTSAPTITQTLLALGHELPEPGASSPHYAPFARTGNLLFISGQIPVARGQVQFIGKLGREFTVEQGQQAACACALNLLAHINAVVGGEVHRVRRIVRLGGFVNALPEFEQLSEVMNGASDLMLSVFGEQARHARTSVGVATLPLGVAVEVDAIVELAE